MLWLSFKFSLFISFYIPPYLALVCHFSVYLSVFGKDRILNFSMINKFYSHTHWGFLPNSFEVGTWVCDKSPGGWGHFWIRKFFWILYEVPLAPLSLRASLPTLDFVIWFKTKFKFSRFRVETSICSESGLIDATCFDESISLVQQVLHVKFLQKFINSNIFKNYISGIQPRDLSELVNNL